MNEDKLRDIEYLRQKANVSYEEASTLLDQNGGDVIRALMVLEQQGRLYPPAQTAHEQTQPEEQWQEEVHRAKEKARPFIEKAFRNRLVIERKREDGSKETVINLSTPLAIGAAIVAPWLAVASAAVTVATGCRVKIENDDTNA